MSVTFVANQVEETLELPIEDLVLDHPRVIALLSAIGDQIQGLEAANYALITERTIDNGEGAQLDLIGRILIEPRRGEDDEDYRRRLRVKVLVNRSNGRIPEILRILALFEGWSGTGNAHALELYPMSLEVRVFTQLQGEIQEIRNLLRRIKGGGVRLDFIYSPSPMAGTAVFGWSGALISSEDQGIGWSGDLSRGGTLSYAEKI